MTHAEEILFAVYELQRRGQQGFARRDIRDFLELNAHDFRSYDPIIQAMRIDEPGGAPHIAARYYHQMFYHLENDHYGITTYGGDLIDGMFGDETKMMMSLEKREEEPLTGPNSGKRTNHHLHARRQRSYIDKVQNILENAEAYHQAFYRALIFGNPCLYFHQCALKTRQDPVSEKHLEYVYATLVAWGMNRPGRGGPKMQDFKTFSSSIIKLKDDILKAQSFDCCVLDNDQWAVLEKIFKGIQVMSSGSNLVANSKAMHQMLPNVIPPVDRTYTLSFLRGNTNLRNDIDYEWRLMKELMTDFFIPVASDFKFQLRAEDWMSKIEIYPWDTSLLKIIDNLIIGARR